MKKLNKKGFMLTETLIVATMLITVLLILYVQFKNVNDNFDESYIYNTVGASYNLYNAKIYIEESNYSLIAEKLKTVDYVDLTSCSSSYFEHPEYCETLFSKLKLKKIIMTNENLYSLIENNDFEPSLKRFLKKINYEKGNGYRIIGQFEDGTFSSIRILNGYKFDYVIANACSASTKVDFTINHLFKNSEAETSGSELYEPSTGNRSCGATIIVENYRKEENSCYYFGGVSKETFDLGLDSSKNVADIYYYRYDSKLNIYHYLEGTTTAIDSTTVIDNYCGNTLYTEQYRKNISGYVFVKPSVDKITLGKNVSSVILYYREV